MPDRAPGRGGDVAVNATRRLLIEGTILQERTDGPPLRWTRFGKAMICTRNPGGQLSVEKIRNGPPAVAIAHRPRAVIYRNGDSVALVFKKSQLFARVGVSAAPKCWELVQAAEPVRS